MIRSQMSLPDFKQLPQYLAFHLSHSILFLVHTLVLFGDTKTEIPIVLSKSSSEIKMQCE